MTRKLAEYVVTSLRKRFGMGKLAKGESNDEVDRMHTLLRMARKRKLEKRVVAKGRAMSSADNLETLPYEPGADETLPYEPSGEMGADESIPAVDQDSFFIQTIVHSDPNSFNHGDNVIPKYYERDGNNVLDCHCRSPMRILSRVIWWTALRLLTLSCIISHSDPH